MPSRVAAQGRAGADQGPRGPGARGAGREGQARRGPQGARRGAGPSRRGAGQVRGGHRQARGQAARGQDQAEGDRRPPDDRASRLKVRRQVHDRRIDDALVRFEQMERRSTTSRARSSPSISGAPRRSPRRSTSWRPTARSRRSSQRSRRGSARGQRRPQQALRAMAMLELPLILFLVIVAPIWIIAHYTTRWRMAKSLSPEDEKQFAELWQIAERMEETDGATSSGSSTPRGARAGEAAMTWPTSARRRPSRRRLYRDGRRAWLAGVCAGHRRLFRAEPGPGAVRWSLLSAVFFTFPTVVGYLIAAFVLQRRPADMYDSAEEERSGARCGSSPRAPRATITRASRTSSGACAPPRRGSHRASSSCAASSAISRGELAADDRRDRRREPPRP